MNKLKSKESGFKTSQPRRFVLLDPNKPWRDRFGPSSAISSSSAAEIEQALQSATSDSLWISSSSQATENLLGVVSVFSAQHHGRRRNVGDLLMLESPRPTMYPALHGCFKRVIGEAPSLVLLPVDELADVLSGDHKSKLFIAGNVDRKTGTLALVRGNLETMTVPLSMFQPSGTHRPDFRRFKLKDYGHTVQFGNYEASADAILYEVDADYRRLLKERRRAHDKGFGPSLRRLRIQRGLSRDAFPGLTEKTIARIERGETEKPRGATLAILEKKLGVSAEGIETY